MHWRFNWTRKNTDTEMYEKQTKNKTQTNKQYKRILERQVRVSEGSPAVCVFPATWHLS